MQQCLADASSIRNYFRNRLTIVMKLDFARFAIACAFSATFAAPLWAAPKSALLGFARWGGEETFIWVVGGYDLGQKKWRDDRAIQNSFYPGTNFGLFDLTGRRGTTTIDRAQFEEVPPGYLARARSKIVGEGIGVAVANVPTPVPRTPRPQTLQSPIYIAAMTNLLRQKGWSGSRARLMQHLRVDLNGDGNEEVLLGAQSHPEMGGISSAKRGYYSAVALRFYDATRKADKVQLVPLQVEIIKRDIQFGAPEGHEILSCVDSNGDGAMEIVVRSHYYEGESITVFAFDGHRVRQVLSAGWGV